MAVWPVPQAVGVAPVNRTSFGTWYCWPFWRKVSVHTSSVEASTFETKRAFSSLAGGFWAVGALCWASGVCSMTPSRVSGLMPVK